MSEVFIKISHGAVSSFGGLLAEEVALRCKKRVVFGVESDAVGELIAVVVEVDKTVVEKEAGVALLAIAVINLLTTLDIVQSLNDKATVAIVIGPACLSRSPMVEHVGICHKCISLMSFDLDSKNARSNHHSHLTVFLQGELAIIRHFFANQTVISLNVLDFVSNLVLERRSSQPFTLFLRVKDREVCVTLGQNVNEFSIITVGFALFLH